MKTVKLLSGYEMPTVGLGTWQAKPEEIETVIATALENGYRHFDTASNYNNEEALGRSFKKWLNSGGNREELFVTTKLPNYGNRPADVEKYLNWSLERLELDYIDMYLIHMPFAFVCDPSGCSPALNEDGTYKLDLDSNPVSVWKEMERQVRNGKVRSIGLSNYNAKQVEEIWTNSEIRPSNLQVELHAYHQQKPLRELCAKHNIAITAYSPLGSPGAKSHFQTKYNYSPEKFPDLLGHSTVAKIAEAHNKTTAQILLRHLVQGNVCVIPKSSSAQRLALNIDIYDFELTPEETQQLDDLDRESHGRIFTFLFFKGVERHPHYPFAEDLP